MQMDREQAQQDVVDMSHPALQWWMILLFLQLLPSHLNNVAIPFLLGKGIMKKKWRRLRVQGS